MKKALYIILYLAIVATGIYNIYQGLRIREIKKEYYTKGFKDCQQQVIDLINRMDARENAQTFNPYSPINNH